MKKIYVSDISIRAYFEQKSALSFRDRLNVAELLDLSDVDCVELPAIINTKEDSVVCRTIASAMKGARVAIDAGDTDESLEAAYSCVKETSSPCIQVIFPVSTVQMEYTYHLKSQKMLEKIADTCKKASAYGCEVEFVARDASRAESGFVSECARVIKENGASAITICDDSGVYFPEDMAAAVKEIKSNCDIKVYVCPSDALHLGAACAVEAVKAGADGIKTSVTGEYLSADTLANVFRVKGEDLDAEVSLDVTAIRNNINKISSGASAPVAPAVEAEAAEFNGDSTIADISKAVADLGYELSDADNGKVFEEFKRVIAKKNAIGKRELEAIVASSAMQVPSTYHVVSYVINSGNIITATANVILEKDGEVLTGVSTGDGPIDAAFHAIEGIIGHRYELDDFQIQSVTKGRESLGSALIRLRANSKLYSGNGVSTDIIGACVRAYVNALNKIVYEEN